MSIKSFAVSSLKKPWVIGAAVIAGGVVLFMLSRQSSGGDGGAMVYQGQSEGSMIANAQLGLQAQQIQAGVNVAAYQAQAGIRAAELEAGVAESAIAAQLATMLAQNAAAENVSLADIEAQRTLGLNTLSTQQQMNLDNLSYGYQTQLANNALVQYQTDAAVTMNDREYDFLQFKEREITDRNQEEQWTQRHADYAPRAGSFLNTLFGGGGFLGGLFSDVRLKRDIKWLGISDNGLNRYSWKYIGSTETHYGYMTQEASVMYPGAVMADPVSGYQMLDYGALA